MAAEGIELKRYIRSIPDWPKKGILFRDITPLLADAKALAAAVDALCAGFTGAGPVRNSATSDMIQKGNISRKTRGNRLPRTTPEFSNGAGIEYVAAVEARGFIFGAAIAKRLGVGFVPIRKKGKLPFKTESVTYDLEYGTDTLEVHSDAVEKGSKVLMVDDLLATGGTMAAACKLIEKIGGQIAGIAFLIELGELAGREKLSGYKISTVISY